MLSIWSYRHHFPVSTYTTPVTVKNVEGIYIAPYNLAMKFIENREELSVIKN